MTWGGGGKSSQPGCQVPVDTRGHMWVSEIGNKTEENKNVELGGVEKRRCGGVILGQSVTMGGVG